MSIRPSDFWQLTIAEFWLLHDAIFGTQEKPVTKDDVVNWEKEWASGKSRRNSNTTNSRDVTAKG